MASKDIDVEVYGIELDALVETLSKYGEVDLAGQSFGVVIFTNPENGHSMDVSIPRKDSKIDQGHRGFLVTGDPNMSVREAARRRDLTINALALDPLTGELTDEYGGVADIKAGILRATDYELFPDDSLRVLRIMQFAGRFDFTVDPQTADLCRSLDLTDLAVERIGKEWRKLMMLSPRPSVGLEMARDLGILEKLHPELAILETIPQEAEWHPEGNVWEHTKHAADAAALVVAQEGLEGEEAEIVLFGALCHDLGKATTTMLREKKGVMRITAHGHEAAGVEPTKRFLSQINIKRSTARQIVPIVQHHLWHVHNPEPSDKALRRFAGHLQPANIRLWDLVSRCDANGRGGTFEPVTTSHKIFERSLQLEVTEQPAPRIVSGKHLIGLGMKPNPDFTPILDALYDAQLGGAFTTPEEGIAYWQATQAAD